MQADFLWCIPQSPAWKTRGASLTMTFRNVGKTGHGKVLQRPIPVIVVVGAEGIGASEELLVGVSVQRHSHVMLGGLPCFHLHFVGFAGVADVSVASKG